MAAKFLIKLHPTILIEAFENTVGDGFMLMMTITRYKREADENKQISRDGLHWKIKRNRLK